MYALDFQGRSIHSFCAYYLRVVTPEGDWPAINDTNFLGLDPGLLRLCAQRTNDRTLAFAASQYMWGFMHAYEHEGPAWHTLFNVVAWADSSLPWKTRSSYVAVNASPGYRAGDLEVRLVPFGAIRAAPIHVLYGSPASKLWRALPL